MRVLSLKRCTALIMSVLVVLGVFAVWQTQETFAKAVKKPAKVKGLAVKRTNLKVKVSWKKAKNARKYQVYQKTGSGKWKLGKTLKARTLTVSGKYGTTYSFKVRGVNGKKKGAFSAVKKVTIPKKSTPKPEPSKPDPEPADDDESVTVYITISDDSDFVIGRDEGHTPIVRVPVKLSYVDLAKYGLQEYYRYEADSFEDGGNYKTPRVICKRPTAMMLIIKALEKWYFCREMTPEDVGTSAYELTGSPTSSYMAKFWDHDENLMYFHNHEYPLMREGWGATSDYVIMEEGDQIDIAMFTDWSFYGRGAFAYFDQDNPNVKVGEELTLTMASNGSSAAQNGTTVNPGKPFPYEYVKVSTDHGKTWEEEVYKTDYEGRFTCSFDKPGVYYLSAGPKFARQGDSAACIAPPVSVVEVAPAPVDEYRLRALSGTTARYTWGEVPNTVKYEVSYKQADDTTWKTVTTDKAELDVTGLKSGSKYQFRVCAIAESDYVPEGEPNKTLKGDYSDIASVTMP